MRELHCDFCSAVVRDHGWDCPAEDFGYSELRIGIDRRGPIVGGSYGGWLACDTCVALVRDGCREELALRSLACHYGRQRVPAAVLADLRSLHDQFWRHRTGPPTLVGPDELARIAAEAAYAPPP